MNRIRVSLKGKFLAGIVITVVPVLGLIFVWTGIRNERHATSQVVNQARILARQIVMTRQWISDCGGIMVARESLGAQGTRYFYDDRLDTSRGVFQRFTPAMVTKKLSAYSMRDNMYQFRLASINPMNPQNNPDPFEREALYNFVHKGAREVFSFDDREKRDEFHYSVPLYVDTACLQCHKNFTKGTIGGCLSISFPMEGFHENLRRAHYRLAAAGVGLILLTIWILFFTLRKVVINPIDELERATSEISNGNFEARVSLKTGDEFERLGQTFNNMGAKLTRSREIMKEKIDQATNELFEANKKLQKTDKLKTEFLADMSHELLSPVTAIKGGLDYLKRTVHDEENKGYLTLVDNNLLRLTHLVSDMLDLTRIEAGKVVWNYEENDLNVLIREIIEILALKAEQKAILVRYAEEEPIWVVMDIERIERVLVNLIENAIKFSPESSRIDINTRVDHRCVSVSITDAGIGIPEENLETIFNKFHTLPSAAGDGRTKGTGLGLTICRKIVEAHGGKIWASRNMVCGSVFTFTLPLKRNGETQNRCLGNSDSNHVI